MRMAEQIYNQPPGTWTPDDAEAYKLLKEIEREHASAQLDLHNAFQDLKALEFANEQQAKRLAEIETRRAQTRMDEMALVRHLRKHSLRSA